MQRFVRFQSAVPNRRGTFPGFFALLRGLQEADRLSDADRTVWAAIFERACALHAEPPASS